MIFAVALNRLMNLRHDRAAFVLSFVVPIVFFSIFAVIFGTNKSSTPRVHVILVDEDRSEGSQRLVSALQREKALVVDGPAPTAPGQAGSQTAASAREAVRKGDAPMALIIPKGFGTRPLGFDPRGPRPEVSILFDSGDPIAPEILTGLLQRAVMTAMPGAPASGGSSAFTPVVVRTEDIVGRKKKNPNVAFFASGLGVMFLLFSAAGAGGALIEEAESGTLDRILATRVSMTQLLLGKLLYLAGLAATQLVVMFVWAALVFHLDLLPHLPGFLIMTVATAVAASTFGLLLAAVSRSRMQLVAIANLVILIMSAVGGSMFPRYLMPEAIQKIGLITLNAWAIDGFQKVFWRDEPLVHLWPQVAVLLLTSVVFMAVARRLAQRWAAT